MDSRNETWFKGLLYLYSDDGLYFVGNKNDFIEGQVMDDGSSVEWANEDSKENKKELKRIQLTSSIVQTWYVILFYICLFTI